MVRNRHHGRGGFSLVELMVIIGILGLVAAIAVPSFNGYLRANLVETSADRIAADMALARSVAVSQGRIVRFAGWGGGYRIIDSTDASIIRDRRFEGTVALTDSVTVNFYPWGAADTVVLTVDDGDQVRSINVLPTGMAEVQP